MPRTRTKSVISVQKQKKIVTVVTVTKEILQCERPYVRFGEEVRAARAGLGWTQKELSERIGLSRASIANIETGRQRILLTDLIDIAAVLGVDPRDLFARCLEP